MGVRAGAFIHDSVTGTPFGPVFDSMEEADAFLDWYNWEDNENNTEDLRLLSDEQVVALVDQWYRETH